MTIINDTCSLHTYVLINQLKDLGFSEAMHMAQILFDLKKHNEVLDT